MRFSVLHRPAESSGAFERVALAPTLGEALDEVESWRGPHLRRGDLVHVVCASTGTFRLYVYDDARGSAVPVKRAGGMPPWVEGWEAGTDAPQMARACAAVDRRRLALAAVACARPHATTPNAAAALADAERWARGGAQPPPVEDRESALWEAGRLSSRGQERLAYAAIAAHYARSICTAAVRAAASAAFYDVVAHLPQNDRARMAAEIRRHIPLSVLACSRVGARDPLPVPPIE